MRTVARCLALMAFLNTQGSLRSDDPSDEEFTSNLCLDCKVVSINADHFTVSYVDSDRKHVELLVYFVDKLKTDSLAKNARECSSYLVSDIKDDDTVHLEIFSEKKTKRTYAFTIQLVSRPYSYIPGARIGSNGSVPYHTRQNFLNDFYDGADPTDEESLKFANAISPAALKNSSRGKPTYDRLYANLNGGGEQPYYKPMSKPSGAMGARKIQVAFSKGEK